MKFICDYCRDEDYRDPAPAGICPMCGEPVYPGDPCYIIDGDMIHADGVLRDYRERGTNRPLRLSCLSAYILDTFSQEDMTEALQIEKKRWI